MGAQIAAHLANAGLSTHLLDVVPQGASASPLARNAKALSAIQSLGKSQPAAFMGRNIGRRIIAGNLEDDLETAVAQSDLVIEAVIERLDVKRPLLARIAGAAKADAILATNTSGLLVGSIVRDLPEAARRRVVGMHFFNPPRYMHLLEVVSSEYTAPEVAEALAVFGAEVLGKGVVRCLDTPNFIGNRIGIAEMLLTFTNAFGSDYTVEEIDTLNGPLMGRPKTGSFRLADLIGIDVAALVVQNLARSTSANPSEPRYDEFHDRMVVPAQLEAMIQKGLLGDKVGKGFYQKAAARDPASRSVVLSLDLHTFEYRPRREPESPELAEAQAITDVRRRVHAALRAPGRGGAFLRSVYLPLFNYAAHRLGEIADDPKAIDDAMRWGYGWELGPFELWDAIGVGWGAATLEASNVRPAPAVRQLLAAQGDGARWYGGTLARPSVFDPKRGLAVPIPESPGTLRLAVCKEQNARIGGNEAASLIDLGDGIACLEFHSKMNSLGASTIEALASALPSLERAGGFRGLVIGNQGANFSAGADISMILASAAASRWDDIERVVAGLQQALSGLQRAPIPVVTAPHGLTLGGGCEVALHGAASVANAETYMGLVEIGVGLLPAGGGLKEIVRRASEWASQVPDGDPYPWIRRAFEATTMATVSGSAHEAVELGYLRPTDPIVFHRDRVIARAKRHAIALAEGGWVPPDPRIPIQVIGASRGANLMMGAQLFVWGGYASPHDQLIARKIVHVLSGGMDPSGRPVTAERLLELEREAFVSLCGEPKTQARLQHMLTTKKPLRN